MQWYMRIVLDMEIDEAPYFQMDGDVPLGVNIHRRNSAPEITESLPFNDDSSMELWSLGGEQVLRANGIVILNYTLK